MLCLSTFIDSSVPVKGGNAELKKQRYYYFFPVLWIRIRWIRNYLAFGIRILAKDQRFKEISDKVEYLIIFNYIFAYLTTYFSSVTKMSPAGSENFMEKEPRYTDPNLLEMAGFARFLSARNQCGFKPRPALFEIIRQLVLVCYNRKD